MANEHSAASARASDFRKVWIALTVSLFGSEITSLALPLMAALTLRATPVEMGILAGARQIPFLLLSLPAGVWVDRLRRRPVLIATDLGSALLLLSVPGAAVFGGPTFAQLCVVAFGIGALTVFAEVAHYAYVPSLVGREHLTNYNSRIQISYSASAAAGPGLAGALIQVVSAPTAVLADAASFVASALVIRSIRRPESEPPKADNTPLRSAAALGIQMLLRHPLMRPIIVGGSILNLFNSAFLALYVLYAVRELGFDPLTIGLIFAAGGLGAIPGALLADRFGERWGVGRSIIVGWAISAITAMVVPLVSGPAALVALTLAAALAFDGITATVANVHQWSLRQAVTPDHLAGRVTAGYRFIVYGAGGTGALMGGLLGEALGLRSALLLCAAGMIAGPVIAAVSPLRRLRRQPTAPDMDSIDLPPTSTDPASSGSR